MKMSYPRRFLARFALVTLIAARPGAAKAAEKYSLRLEKPDGSTVAVVAALEVGGYLKADGEGQPKQIPMSVVAQFNYEEQRMDDGADANHRLAVRYYDSAAAAIKVGEHATRPQLRDDRKIVAATVTKDDVFLSSPGGPLTREELDLIDIPGNTLVIDQILPADAIEIGGKWNPSQDTVCRLLGLDAVGHTEVECQLVAVENNVAEITINGSLGGAINGVASDIELKGKLLIDLSNRLPKSLLLAIKEERGIGHVGFGLDVVAKLKLTIAPQEEPKFLTAETLASTKLPETDQAPPLEYRSDAKGYRFLYDRRWHITREEPELVVMRLVERGDMIAQCNIAPSTKALEKPVELIQFQNDVQSALGKMFNRFERASERGTDSGLRILQTTVAGSAQELPIQWRYYLIHDHDGRGLTMIFTLEEPLVQQFGTQDKPIIDSVEFIEPKMAAAVRSGDGQAK
jgi:hypothetical protein